MAFLALQIFAAIDLHSTFLTLNFLYLPLRQTSHQKDHIQPPYSYQQNAQKSFDQLIFCVVDMHSITVNPVQSNQNITRTYMSTYINNTKLIKMTQKLFTHTRYIPGDFFRGWSRCLN